MTFAPPTESGPDSPDVPMWVRWLLLALLVGLFFPGPGLGQPVPDPALETVGHFGKLYPNEIAFCWSEGTGVQLPKHRTAHRLGLHANCPDTTRVHIHTHPVALLTSNDLRSVSWRLGFYKAHDRDPRGPRDLCYLSKQDVAALVKDGFEAVVVVVTPEVYCWWSRTDVLTRRPYDAYNEPPDGQTSWEDEHE